MVNQRGFASGTLNDGDYGFDRWSSASGASVLALNADDVTLTSGKLMQKIEDPHIAGKQITISAKVNSGTLTGRVGTTDAFQTLPFTTTASSGDIRLELVGNGSVFTNVQLELGSVATDFEHRSYGEELALCARYYQEVYYGGTPSNAGYPNSFGPWLSLPVTMRVSPTVARSTFSGRSFYDYPGANVNSSNLVFHAVHVLGMTNTAVRAYYTGSANRSYFEGYITAEAEL
jgi:hypothetical protein